MIKFIIKIFIFILFLASCQRSEDKNSVRVSFEGTTAELNRKNWDKPVRVFMYDYQPRIKWLVDDSEKFIYVLDQFEYIWKLDYNTGKILKKEQRFGQVHYNYGRNDIFLCNNILFWSNGLHIWEFDQNLNKINYLTDTVFAFVDDKYNGCSMSHELIIDTVFCKESDIWIKFDFCQLGIDSIKIEDYFK